MCIHCKSDRYIVYYMYKFIDILWYSSIIEILILLYLHTSYKVKNRVSNYKAIQKKKPPKQFDSHPSKRRVCIISTPV